MKYKDRKQAKRKYKQAALAAVTALTLGVSALGGTVSAFAAEKENDVTQQQNNAQEKINGNYYGTKSPLSQLEDFRQAIANKTKWQDQYNSIGQILPEIYKDAYSDDGSFNNTFRTLGLVSTSLIPYVGAFISPILGLIWPESGPNIGQLLKAMEERLANLMDEKIDKFDQSSLTAEIRGMMDNLKPLENSVNGTIQYYSTGDVDSLNQQRAVSIENSFQRLKEISRKDGFQISELPLFTIIATAHLNFLHFMENNGTSPKINYTSGALKDFLQNMKKNQDDYIGYIKDMYKQGEAKINSKIANVGTKAGSILLQINGGYTAPFDEAAVKSAIASLKAQKQNLEANEPSNTHDTKAMNQWQAKLDAINAQLNPLEDYLSQYNTLVNQKNDYYNKTQNNDAFKLAAGLITINDIDKKDNNNNQNSQSNGWYQENGKYFYNKDGIKQTGWIKDDGRSYYLSPVTDGNWKTGQMVTGWAKVDNNWYYLMPKAENNYKEGEMVHGSKVNFIEIPMLMTIDGKAYSFDSSGKCTNA